MLIIGYCRDIRSERRPCDEVHLNLAHRWFFRLGLEGRVPDHSTFSRNRHGRFRDSDLLRRLFEIVLERCIDAGLLDGEASPLAPSRLANQGDSGPSIEFRDGSPVEPRADWWKMTETSDEGLVELTVGIVSAYVGSNKVPTSGLAGLIADVHAALRLTNAAPVATRQPEPLTPAVSVKKSIGPDFLICLEDGKRFKTLKRHLRTAYGLTPDQYREKWGLPFDYPMVAPNYAVARSALAKESGLGQKRRRPA